MSEELGKNYDRFYDERIPGLVYPVESVIRAKLGNDPRLNRNRIRSKGGKILDLHARVGKNRSIPFPDAEFDHLLACRACCNIDPGTTFTGNLDEIGRVLKPVGRFVFSVTIGSSYIFTGSHDPGGGHMGISKDPYGIRNGYMLKKFDSGDEIAEALSRVFTDVFIGSCSSVV